jgi:molybdenum cofactor biosynthesis enzyme
MEAMMGASAAALCVYDMLKALSHDIQVSLCVQASAVFNGVV